MVVQIFPAVTWISRSQPSAGVMTMETFAEEVSEIFHLEMMASEFFAEGEKA